MFSFPGTTAGSTVKDHSDFFPDVPRVRVIIKGEIKARIGFFLPLEKRLRYWCCLSPNVASLAKVPALVSGSSRRRGGFWRLESGL